MVSPKILKCHIFYVVGYVTWKYCQKEDKIFSDTFFLFFFFFFFFNMHHGDVKISLGATFLFIEIIPYLVS